MGGDGCCGGHGGGCGGHEHGGHAHGDEEFQDEADKMLMLAHKARKKLLLDKMKQEWEKREGKELTAKAAAAVDALITEWDEDDAADERHEKLLDKLR